MSDIPRIVSVDARIRNAEINGYGSERLGTDFTKSWSVSGGLSAQNPRSEA
jgi:hypothetical protein